MVEEKSAVLTLRMTQEQLKLVRGAAAGSKRKVSEWVRMVLVGVALGESVEGLMGVPVVGEVDHEHH